jgi:hypothetical protein
VSLNGGAEMGYAFSEEGREPLHVRCGLESLGRWDGGAEIALAMSEAYWCCSLTACDLYGKFIAWDRLRKSEMHLDHGKLGL